MTKKEGREEKRASSWDREYVEAEAWREEVRSKWEREAEREESHASTRGEGGRKETMMT